MTRDVLLGTLVERGGISVAEAEKVADLYRKVRAIRYNAHDGFQIVHGGFFDRAVIRRALRQVSRGTEATGSTR